MCTERAEAASRFLESIFLPFSLLTPAAAVDVRQEAGAVYAHTYVAGAVLVGLVGLAYAAWHSYLKWGRGAEVSHAVWLVLACMLLSVLPDVLLAVILEAKASLPGLVANFVDLSTSLLWCLSILLIARGWQIQGPTLSDEGRKHFRQVLIAAGGTWALLILLALPLPGKVSIAFGLLALVGMLVFLVLFVLRFFQGIQATRSAIDIQNLIPTGRRVAFDLKYKRFLFLCLGMIAFSVLKVAVEVGYALFLSYNYDNSRPPVGAILAFRILDILSSLTFNVLFALIFHCRPDESLRLWSTTRNDLGGFENLQEQDEDLFA